MLLVFIFLQNKGLPVTGLEYFCTASRGGGKNEYCIFATTSSRLYQFSGIANINGGDVPVFQVSGCSSTLQMFYSNTLLAL